MFSFEIPRGRIWDWLEYETGYEQLHPKREIVFWMEDQGYRLGQDWRIEVRPKGIYYIYFNDTKTAEIFLMRWS